MPDPRTCAVCRRPILWCAAANGGIVALDEDPVPDGDYAIVCGRAILVVANLHQLQAPMLDGPRYRNHVKTCKPPERKKHAT